MARDYKDAKRIAVPICIDPQGRRMKAVDGKEICATLRANTHGNEPMAVLPVGNSHPSGHGMNGNVFSVEGCSPTVTTNKGEGNKICCPVLTPERVEKRQNGRRFKDNGEESFTLTAQDRHGVGIGVGGGYNAARRSSRYVCQPTEWSCCIRSLVSEISMLHRCA